MNIRGTRGRLAGLIAATALVAGIAVAGTATGAVAGGSSDAAAATVAQPAAANPALAIAGGWTLTTDWDCDGSITGSFTMTFNADGTWVSSGHSGRWFQVGSTAVWTFTDVANLVYSGNVSGSWISGVQGYELAGGIKGCFGGHLSSVAGLSATAGRTDAATGR